VYLNFLKLWWVSASGAQPPSPGRMSRSSTLIANLRREIGRYEVPRWRALLAFEMGIIVACFQTAGILDQLRDELKTRVRYCRPI